MEWCRHGRTRASSLSIRDSGRTGCDWGLGTSLYPLKPSSSFTGGKNRNRIPGKKPGIESEMYTRLFKLWNWTFFEFSEIMRWNHERIFSIYWNSCIFNLINPLASDGTTGKRKNIQGKLFSFDSLSLIFLPHFYIPFLLLCIILFIALKRTRP